ncbi:MAG: type II secretion system F family protein [Actinomycetota bacterium]
MDEILNTVTGSDLWLLIILGTSFLAAFLVAVMLLTVGHKGRRRRSLARLMLGRRRAKEQEAKEAQWMPTGLVQAGRRVASAGGFSVRLDDRLEQAGVPMRAGEFVALTAVGAVAGAIVGAILLPNIFFMLMVAAGGGLLPYLWLLRAIAKRQKRLSEQLSDTLSILASALRAGHSFLQALDQVAKEINEPSASEFQRVVSEIRLGRPVEDSLLAMADRVASEDLRWAVLAVNIQREVGGNLAEVLDIVANTVRERAYVHRQVRVLSAEGRISVTILSVLPFLIAMYIAIVNPEYIGPLFTTTAGRIMLVVGGSLMGLGIFVMSRMVRIDV